MDHRIARLRAALAAAALLTGMVALAGQGIAFAQDAAQEQAPGPIIATEVRGVITPVIANHLEDVIARAEARSARLVVVELDTPGGLISSMRSIVQAFLNADVPVAVHVSPAGADAGSAGTFITLAAHVAAMSPATTIGAATPVDLEGGEVGDKIVNNAAAYAEAIAEARGRDVEFAVDSVRKGRSITADEALSIGAIDLIAADLGALLEAVDGRVVEMVSGEVTLETVGVPVERFDLSGTRRLLQALADPNLAFIFISIGTLAIIYEIANPGLGFGGVLGGVMLILAFFSLAVLPVNIAGAALLVLASGLFIAELFTPGLGVAGGGGTLALLLGGLFLFQEPSGLGVDLRVLLPTVIVMFVLVVLAGWAVARSRRMRLQDPADDLLGRTATLVGVTDGHPRVRLDGTGWRVRPDDGVELSDGVDVEVIGRDNIDLVVRPVAMNDAVHDAPRDMHKEP